MPVRGGRRRELKSLGSTYLEMDPLLSAPIPAKFHLQASAPAESWALLSLNCLLQLLPHSHSPLPSPPFFLAPKSSVSGSHSFSFGSVSSGTRLETRWRQEDLLPAFPARTTVCGLGRAGEVEEGRVAAGRPKHFLGSLWT